MKKTIAFVLGAFLLGGVLGALAFRRPAHEERKEKVVAQAESHKTLELDSSWMWRMDVTTPKKTITTKKKNYRPAPTGGCELASEEETKEEIGSGSASMLSDQKLKLKDSQDYSLFNLRESSFIKMDAPRWSFAVLAGTNVKLEPMGAVTISYRLIGDFTLNAAAVVPFDWQEAAVFGGAGFTH